MTDQEVIVTFRINAAFLVRVDRVAEEEGIDRSEKIRNALHKEIDCPLWALEELRREWEEKLNSIRESIERNADILQKEAKTSEE